MIIDQDGDAGLAPKHQGGQSKLACDILQHSLAQGQCWPTSSKLWFSVLKLQCKASVATSEQLCVAGAAPGAPQKLA